MYFITSCAIYFEKLGLCKSMYSTNCCFFKAAPAASAFVTVTTKHNQLGVLSDHVARNFKRGSRYCLSHAFKASKTIATLLIRPFLTLFKALAGLETRNSKRAATVSFLK